MKNSPQNVKDPKRPADRHGLGETGLRSLVSQTWVGVSAFFRPKAGWRERKTLHRYWWVMGFDASAVSATPAAEDRL